MTTEDIGVEIDGATLSRGFVNYLRWLWTLSVVAVGLWMFGVVTDGYLLLLVVLIVAAILTVTQHRVQNNTRD